MALRLPPTSTQKPSVDQKPVAKGKGKGKAGAATGASDVQQVHAPDEMVGGESVEGGTASPSSPLTNTVWDGLQALAQKYYGDGDHTARDGLNVLLRARTDGRVDIDKVMSPEARELKAVAIARDTGLDKDTARDLIDNLALILSP